ncbi:hypothetical protein D3C80_812680 [compost metagenome]
MCGAKTFEAFFDQKGRDAPRAGGHVRLGINHQRIGLVAIGDPHLRAVQEIAVALAFGLQPHRHDIRPGFGLAHRERTDMFAGNQLRKISALLIFRSPAVNLIDAEVGMRTVGKADGSGSPAYLLHRHAMGEIAHVSTAVLFRNGDAVQAEFAHLRPELARKLVVAIDLGGERGYFIVGECSCAVAQRCDFRAEIGIENSGEVQTHRVSSSGRPFVSVPLVSGQHLLRAGNSHLWRVTPGEGGGTAHECLDGEIGLDARHAGNRGQEIQKLLIMR